MKKIMMNTLCVFSIASSISLTSPNVAAAEPSTGSNTSTMSPTLSNESKIAKSAAEKPAIDIITRPEIMGLWGMEIPNNKRCVEYYNFRSANDVVINSGKEWSYAQYDYQPTLDPTQALAGLVMQIKFDNNQADCSGYQQDQTGEVAQYFVRWKDASHIQFCASEKGDKCVANLRRVLP